MESALHNGIEVGAQLFGLFFGIVVGKSIAFLLLSAQAPHGSIRCSLITDELCVLSIGLDCICRTLNVFLGRFPIL